MRKQNLNHEEYFYSGYHHQRCSDADGSNATNETSLPRSGNDAGFDEAASAVSSAAAAAPPPAPPPSVLGSEVTMQVV